MPQSIHRLMVSDCLFKLATRAIQAYSLRTQRFESVNTTVETAAEQVLGLDLVEHDLSEQLAAVDLDGSIRIHLVVKDSWTTTFRAAWRKLEQATARTLTVKQCFFLTLYLFLRGREKKVNTSA